MLHAALRVFSIAIALAPAVVCASPVPPFYISCEGTQSTGGGARLYQYEIQNMSAAPQTLTDLRIGTDDLNVGDYTNILSPPNFSFAVNLGDTQLATTTVKTPHGQFVPNMAWVRQTAGMIHWSNPQGLLLNPGATAVFGFNNSLASEDVEWVGTATGGVITIGRPTAPVAGPLGVFTNGPVHAPVPEPTAAACVLASVALMLRRR
jgi:hypothetical protein